MHQTTKTRKAGRIQAVLDIGSSKVACLIVENAKLDELAQSLDSQRVLGVGYQRSAGIKGGVVFDPLAVELSIRGAVDKAERQAGHSLDQITICMNAGRMRSQNYGAVVELAGAKVKPPHVEMLLRRGWGQVAQSSEAILHSLPLGFTLDGVSGIDNPVGFSGQRLHADFHVVSAELGHVRRLLSCVEDAYLSPVSVVVTPYASALATLRQKEAREGAAVLDLGGGTSSLAVFSNGKFIFANSLAKGGIAISAALARNFNMSWADADRLKLHMGARPEHRTAYPKGNELISHQLMGIFLHQKKKMMDAGFVFDAVKYVVLTGGTSLYCDAPRIAAADFWQTGRALVFQVQSVWSAIAIGQSGFFCTMRRCCFPGY